MLLAVFAHVDAHQGVFIVKHKFGQRFGKLGFAQPRKGPMKIKEPIGRVWGLSIRSESGEWHPKSAWMASSWPIRRSCRRSSILQAVYRLLIFHHLAETGIPVHWASTSATSSLIDPRSRLIHVPASHLERFSLYSVFHARRRSAFFWAARS